MIIYKNSADKVTIQDCIMLNEKGIAVIINNGKDVTFEIKKESIAHQAK